MKKLIDKFRLFFLVSIVLFGFILLYPLVVCLCFIGNDKISKAIVELINKSLSVISLLVWLKSISEK
jgi:hypothetical protein